MWSARFTESQLETLKELIRIQGDVGADLEGALEALELARWDDLPEAELPWKAVAEQAALQGISEADVIWDMAGRKKEHPVPRDRVAARQFLRAGMDYACRAAFGRRRSYDRRCPGAAPGARRRAAALPRRRPQGL